MSDCTQCADYEWCAKNEECGMFKQKQMTNADRVRVMSDEELAEWIVRRTEGYGFDGYDASVKAWLDWLRMEAANENI